MVAQFFLAHAGAHSGYRLYEEVSEHQYPSSFLHKPTDIVSLERGFASIKRKYTRKPEKESWYLEVNETIGQVHGFA